MSLILNRTTLLAVVLVAPLAITACSKKGTGPAQPGSPEQEKRSPSSTREEAPSTAIAQGKRAAGKEAPGKGAMHPTSPAISGTVSVQKPSAPAPAQELAKPLPPRCLSATFTRNVRSGEDLAQSRNLLRLTDLGIDQAINPKSICVRVNGVPVKHRPLFTKGKEKQLRGLILDPIPNPKASITTTFCVGKNTCAENCKIPRDEFMDAIGGLDTKGGGWDSNESEVMGALDGRLKRELEAGSDYELSDRWAHAQAEPACLTTAEKAQLGRTLANQK